jgi:hypothetical protein
MSTDLVRGRTSVNFRASNSRLIKLQGEIETAWGAIEGKGLLDSAICAVARAYAVH